MFLIPPLTLTGRALKYYTIRSGALPGPANAATGDSAQARWGLGAPHLTGLEGDRAGATSGSSQFCPCPARQRLLTLPARQTGRPPWLALFAATLVAMRINGAKSGFCTNLRQVELEALRLALGSYNQRAESPHVQRPWVLKFVTHPQVLTRKTA